MTSITATDVRDELERERLQQFEYPQTTTLDCAELLSRLPSFAPSLLFTDEEVKSVDWDAVFADW